VTEPPRAVRPEDISVIMPVGGDPTAARRAVPAVLRFSPPPGEFLVVADGIPIEARAWQRAPVPRCRRGTAERPGVFHIDHTAIIIVS